MVVELQTFEERLAERVAEMHAKIDDLESMLVCMPEPDHRTIHGFSRGLYSRTFVMPAGSIYTSKIHRTEHHFVVRRGLCSVLNVLTNTWEHLSTGHMGITKPGTRRVLVIHEETTWTTFHPTEETDLGKLEEQLIEPHAHTLSLAEQRRQPCLG